MPITISAILSSIGKNIDSMTVVRILKDIIGEELAIKKYGILSSKVDVLIAFPLSLNIAISTSLIPEISKRKAIGDLDGIIKKIEFSIMVTSLIGIPCAFGMGFYSEVIFNLLFPKAKEGFELLRLASIGIIFSLLTQTITGILQGIGKNNIPVYTSLIGIFIKIILNIILIPIENIYEKGAIIGNIVSSFVSFIIVYITLKKNIDLKISIIRNTFKPILASIIMLFISYKFYKIMIMKKISSIFCTIITIAISVFIYILCCFFMKIFKNLKEILET
jgi:stage V sporulation protein B